MCRGGVYVRHEYLLFGRGRPYRRDRIEGNFGKVAERLAIGQPGEPRRLGNVGQDRPVAGAQLRMALGAQPRPRRIDVRLPFTVDQDMADRDRVISLRQRDRMAPRHRSEEHTSELQSLMRISYAVFCLKKKTITPKTPVYSTHTSYNHQATSDTLITQII